MKINEVSVIWCQEWKWPGESLASILLKASYVNSLDSIRLKRKVGTQWIMPTSGGDFLAYTLDMAKVSTWLKISREDLEAARLAIFLSALGWSPVLSQRLRYCSACLSCGYHSKYFQITALDKCPVHQIKLEETCPHCNSFTSAFGLCRELFDHPYYCFKCGGLLSTSPPSIRSFFLKPADAAVWECVWEPLVEWEKKIALLPLCFSSLRAWVKGYGRNFIERQIDAMHIYGIFSPLPAKLSWRPPLVPYRSFRYVESSYQLTRSYRVEDAALSNSYRIAKQSIERRFLSEPKNAIEEKCKLYGWQVFELKDDTNSLDSVCCAYIIWRMLFEDLLSPDELETDNEVAAQNSIFPIDWQAFNARQLMLVIRGIFRGIWAEVDRYRERGMPLRELAHTSLLKRFVILPHSNSQGGFRGVLVLPALFRHAISGNYVSRVVKPLRY